MQKIFLAVIDMSIVSSLVILAVLLVRALLKRAPRRFSYVLWAAVLLRLLCPFAVESPLSLIPEQAGEIAQSAALPEGENVTFVSAASAAYRAIGDTANGGEDFIRVEVAPDPAVVQGGEPESERQYVSASHGQVWLMLCAWLWPAGTAAVLIWGIVGQIRLRRLLVGAVKLENASKFEADERNRAAGPDPLGSKERNGEVWLADHIPTAFVMGLVRPKIYLPSNLEGPGRDYVLAHERAHVRRGDHITRLLAFAALALHWFNPLVWLAFAMSGRDMEMSCDEAVMRRSGADIRADYCQTLLDMSANKHFPSPCLLAFGEGDTGARVRNALRWKKPAFWAVCGAAVLIVVACVLLLTNQAGKKGVGDGQTVELSFPGYYMMDGNGGKVPSPGPFVAEMKLPEGWSTRQGADADADAMPDTHKLRDPAFIYDENGNCAAFAAWGGLTDYDLFYNGKFRDAYGEPVEDPVDLLRNEVLAELVKKTDWEHTRWDEYNISEDGGTRLVDDIYARDVGATDRRAVCSYSAELEAYVLIEFADGSAYEDAARLIAESIQLRAAEPGGAGQTVKVSFPGHYVENGRVWMPGPFVASVVLPEGWRVGSGYSLVPEGVDGEGYSHVFFHNAEDELVAKMCYRAFKPDAEAPVSTEGLTEQEARRMSFCTELYGKNWRDFESVAYSDTAETFRATILRSVENRDGKGHSMALETRYGIGRYDTGMGVYVAMELYDSLVSDSEAGMIAESLELYPVGVSSEFTYFGFGGYDYSSGIRRGRGDFIVNMKLPEGWSSWRAIDKVDAPDAENLPDTHGLLSPGYIYNEDGRCVAFVAWAGFDPNAYVDDTTDRGLSTAVNAALKERTDWAKYGWEQLEFSANSGTVYVSQIIDSDDVDTGRRGICVYNRAMEAVAVVEFADGVEYDWAARLIAGSISMQSAGFNSSGREQEIIVPGYYREGGLLMECRPFSAKLTLPAGWTLGGTVPEEYVNSFGLRPLAYMYDKAGNYAGVLGWQETGRSSRTQGLLAEDAELGVCVCAELVPGAISDEDLDEMARSVEIKPGRVQYIPCFAGMYWGTEMGEAVSLPDGEQVSMQWSFLGHECVAYYGVGPDSLLSPGHYCFNGEGDLSREETIALYEQLLAELEFMYGESNTPVLEDLTPMDIQSVISGKSDTACNTWTKQSPDGKDVDICLGLNDGDITVRYSLLYES